MNSDDVFEIIHLILMGLIFISILILIGEVGTLYDAIHSIKMDVARIEVDMDYIFSELLRIGR